MNKPLPSAAAQLSLGFGDDIPTERLFFAVMPDPSTAARIVELATALCDEHGLTGKLLQRDRLHVTLHHLGDYAGVPPGLLARAQQAAARLRLPAFEVCFDQVGSFAGNRQHPFVLRGESGVERLHALQQELGRCLQGIGNKPGHAFTPHVTLLYDRRRLPLQPVQPLRWHVGEFVLIRSFLGQTRYQLEGRWPLG